MKRHPSFHPLSRDHHHALVQARKLSLSALEIDSDTLRRAAEHFADFWETDLKAHFRQEEQFVLPLLAAAPESAETLRQHAEITRLVAELAEKLARQELIEADFLGALAEKLRQHIRFEENELFPAIERQATEEELQRMHEQLEAERDSVNQVSCAFSPRQTIAER